MFIKVLKKLLILLLLVGCSNKQVIDETVEEEVVEDYSYNKDYLTKDNFYYYDDDKYTSKMGIDVSVFQDDIDFNKVKQAGIEFVYIRLGYRGKSEGELHLDSKFNTYYKDAKKAGLLVGIYFFSQAINVKEAVDEADFVVRMARDLDLDLPIALDYEEPYASRIENLNSKQRTDNANGFIKTIKNNNYEVIVYTNQYWLNTYYNDNLIDVPIWLAQYDVEFPNIDKLYYIWQYSDVGKVDGIDTYVDLDIMFIPKQTENN